MNEALSTWQIDEIKKGIEEADRGEFASDREVQKVLKNWSWKDVSRRFPESCSSPEGK